MKTEQKQRQAIRQILFDANDICQDTPCENEYCIYHGDYRCYDNVIVDKLIKAGYGDVSEYKAEIERLEKEMSDTRKGIAKEILQTLYDKCYEINDETGESMGNFVSDDDILYLAKHYGVEVTV